MNWSFTLSQEHVTCLFCLLWSWWSTTIYTAVKQVRFINTDLVSSIDLLFTNWARSTECFRKDNKSTSYFIFNTDVLDWCHLIIGQIIVSFLFFGVSKFLTLSKAFFINWWKWLFGQVASLRKVATFISLGEEISVVIGVGDLVMSFLNSLWSLCNPLLQLWGSTPYGITSALCYPHINTWKISRYRPLD